LTITVEGNRRTVTAHRDRCDRGQPPRPLHISTNAGSKDQTFQQAVRSEPVRTVHGHARDLAGGVQAGKCRTIRLNSGTFADVTNLP